MEDRRGQSMRLAVSHPLNRSRVPSGHYRGHDEDMEEQIVCIQRCNMCLTKCLLDDTKYNNNNNNNVFRIENTA